MISLKMPVVSALLDDGLQARQDVSGWDSKESG
jgi:hypothetical protein